MFLRKHALCVAWLTLAAAGAPPRASALDLPEALGQALRSNPTLAARRDAVEAARFAVEPAGAWSSPMVEFGVLNVPQGGGLDQDPMTMTMVGITQRISLSGTNRLGRDAAAGMVTAEQARAAKTTFQVLGMTWERYADAAYALDRLREALAHRGLMQRMVDAARVRYESGGGRLDDVLRVEAERARVAADLATDQAMAVAARARLAEVMGGTATLDSAILAPLSVAPIADRPDVWQAAVGDTHPELQESQARAASYRLAARASRRSVWPDLELHGAYGFRDRLADGTEQKDMFSLTAGVTLPLFAGQREGASADQMDALAHGADAERRAAALALRAEVHAAWAAALAAQRTVAIYTDTVMVAQRRAVDASWASYGAGATDLGRVLETSHAYYGEALALVEARQDLARAQARLVALTGRIDLLGVTVSNVERSGQ